MLKNADVMTWTSRVCWSNTVIAQYCPKEFGGEKINPNQVVCTCFVAKLRELKLLKASAYKKEVMLKHIFSSINWFY